MIQSLKRFALTVFLLSATAFPINAQNIFTEGIKANLPTVRFSFENPALQPPTYEISVDITGEADYFSRDDQYGESENRRSFQVSKATRDRIFALTDNLRKFRGDYEYRKHKIAFTGKKTFFYKEGAEEYSTQFNWSENKEITELADLFQGLANTIQAEYRLTYLLKHDKLGLNAELAQLERKAKAGWLKEIGAIHKVLRQVAQDSGVMGMARERANRLLRLAATK